MYNSRADDNEDRNCSSRRGRDQGPDVGERFVDPRGVAPGVDLPGPRPEEVDDRRRAGSGAPGVCRSMCL